MPELPEVEVIKKSLENKLKILDKSIIYNHLELLNSDIDIELSIKDFVNTTTEEFDPREIISVKRRSKYLLINLNQNSTILAHLGMTGKFFIIDSNNKKHKTSFYYSLKKNNTKHDHLTIFLNKGFKLVYNDVRKFGFIKLFLSKNVYKCAHLRFLGPEPLFKEFNINYFNKYILRKKKIKDLLMDQRFFACLGNILPKSHHAFGHK